MKLVKPLNDLTFTPGITVQMEITVQMQTCANEGKIFVSLTTRPYKHNQTEKQAAMWPEENRYVVKVSLYLNSVMVESDIGQWQISVVNQAFPSCSL